MQRYLLSSPLHILWVIYAYQWFLGYLIQPLPGERPVVLPLCLLSGTVTDIVSQESPVSFGLAYLG